MIVRTIPGSLPDLLGAKQYTPRTNLTAHVSAIIKHILIGLDPKRYGGTRGPGGEPSEAARNMWEIGLAFEDVLSQALVDRFTINTAGHVAGLPRYFRPGEFTADRITGTPDILDILDRCVEEWKCTWMSSRLPLEDDKFWHYWVQLKAYLKLVGYRKGRLRVLHLNGDYSRDGQGPCPVFRCVEAEFTQVEIDENWAMLKSHAKVMGWV
jgi:hypothetical protein